MFLSLCAHIRSMALTYVPEDTSDLNLKTQRDVTCEKCGMRRTVDGYDEPTIASCIAEGCETYLVIPAYPFVNGEIVFTDTEETARNMYNSLLEE